MSECVIRNLVCLLVADLPLKSNTLTNVFGGFQGKRGTELHTFFVRFSLFLLWLLWCYGGSTVDVLGEDDWRIVVVLLLVVFCVVFALVVSLSRACCLVVRCWLGIRSDGDKGRGSCWLCKSASYEVTFNGTPFRAVFRRSEPCRVAREISIVSVGSVWL